MYGCVIIIIHIFECCLLSAVCGQAPVNYTFAAYLPVPCPQTIIRALSRPGFGKHMSTIVPMLIINVVQNLANVESARSVGDMYDATPSLFWDAGVTVISACFGNAFPPCIYIGHPAIKVQERERRGGG